MNAKDRREFSRICEGLAETMRRKASAGKLDMPYCPLRVAEVLSSAAEDLWPVLAIVQSD